ncbi:hypothetical protein, partial [Polyangium sorediatum]
DQRGAGPRVEKLRGAQFFKQADEEAGVPAEAVARLSWWGNAATGQRPMVILSTKGRSADRSTANASSHDVVV